MKKGFRVLTLEILGLVFGFVYLDCVRDGFHRGSWHVYRFLFGTRQLAMADRRKKKKQKSVY